MRDDEPIELSAVDAVAHGAPMLAQAMRHARLALCLTDPTQPDNPIVFVNRAFLDVTGYEEAEVLGRNCRFLQCEQTDRDAVQRVRDALRERRLATVDLVNRRKDGTRFVNALQLGPIYDADGALTHFFGSQLDVTEAREAEARQQELRDAELRHRLINVVNVLEAVVRMTGQEEPDPAKQNEKIRQRVRAVGEAHLVSLVEGGDRVELERTARTILSAYAADPDRNLRLEGPTIPLTRKLLSVLALLLHELGANAVKHGALGRLDGRVDLTWRIEPAARGRDLVLDWRESGGPAVAPPTRAGGSAILRKLLAAAGGDLSLDWRREGLAATARLLDEA